MRAEQEIESNQKELESREAEKLDPKGNKENLMDTESPSNLVSNKTKEN